MTEHKRWADTAEVGFLMGIRFLFWLYRHSRWLLKLILHPVILYYFAANRTARNSSMNYLKHLQQGESSPDTPVASWLNVYRHLSTFAHSSLDKLGVWAESEQFSKPDFPSRQILLDQIESGRGAVLLGAHLGNMEICRRMSQDNLRMKLNVLVHTKHADRFNKLMRELDIHHELELIEVSELSPATAIRLSNCVERGEFIAILADRIPVASRGRAQAVTFMGENAYFPEGPFILASLLKCPVYTLFCTQTNQSYSISCEKFSDQIILPRQDRSAALRHYIQKFAGILEKNVRKTPLQWFNFYPFWNQTP